MNFRGLQFRFVMLVAAATLSIMFVLAAADEAMYAVKHTGKNAFAMVMPHR
jgi:GGDEF domain-containing protein